MENIKNKKILLYSIFIIIILVVAYIIYITVIDKEKKIIEDVKTNANKKNDELIQDSEKYKKYLEIIPKGVESFNINEYKDYKLSDSDISVKLDYHVLLKDAYSGKKETIQTVSPLSYLPIAYRLSKESPKFLVTNSFCGDSPCEADRYVSVNDFSSKLKELYNINAPTRDNFFTGGGGAEKTNDYYVDYHARGATIPFKASKYIRHEVVQDDLIIYEKAGFCIFRWDLSYKPSNLGEVYDILVDTSSNAYISIEMKDRSKECDLFVESNIEDFKTFKHTFKPNEESYYWFSTEVVD